MSTTQTTETPVATTAKRPAVDSSQLLQGARELPIRHRGETYRLRLTRAGKLILTK